MTDLLPPQDGSLHYLSNKQRNGLTQLISMKSMAIYLIIPYYFYTNINFQRPMSHLILIWDPLKLHHFWTLLINLSNFARSIPLSLLLPPLSNKQKLACIPYCCEIYGHLIKNSLLFLYKLKFSESYIFTSY